MDAIQGFLVRWNLCNDLLEASTQGIECISIFVPKRDLLITKSKEGIAVSYWTASDTSHPFDKAHGFGLVDGVTVGEVAVPMGLINLSQSFLGMKAALQQYSKNEIWDNCK